MVGSSSEGALNTCGACIAFLAEGEAEDGPFGRCRLRPELGVIGHSLPFCPKYVERGTGRTAKPKKRAVHGRARGWYDDTEVEVQPGAEPAASREPSPAERPAARASRPPRQQQRSKPPSRPKRYGATIDLGEENMDTKALRALLEDILFEDGIIDDSPMADKWVGGTVVLKPADSSMQPKEIPIETLFHKIVMVRDKLRVMEQKINASKGLNDKEKVDLQANITRVYGSLTTFNVMFKDRSDQFSGSKS